MWVQQDDKWSPAVITMSADEYDTLRDILNKADDAGIQGALPMLEELERRNEGGE